MQNSLPIKQAVVTGANGFIGRWLTTALTKSNVEVIAFMRNAAQKIDELKQWVQQQGGTPALVTALEFDLMADQLGLDESGIAALTQADVVYHLAAKFSFGLDPAVAHRANVTAATELVRLCAGNPRLRRFIHISGYRTLSRAAQTLDIDSPISIERYYQTHGAYEASKLIAHEQVCQAAAAYHVPLTRMSPASVIGDSQTGATRQIFGLAEMVKQLWQGKLPVLVGSADTWLPVITVDFLATLLVRLPSDTASVGAHYGVFDDSTPVLPKLITLIASHMNRQAPKHRLSLNAVRNLPVTLTGVEKEALSFISDDRYDPKPLADLCKRLNLTLPPLAPSVTRWVDYLLDTAFLEQPAPLKQDKTIAGVRVFATGSFEQAEVVLLHGILLTGQSWQAVNDQLLPSTLTLDLPGLGRSAYGGGRPDEWMTAALAGLDRSPTIVGHSLGTGFALDYAAAHPERVKSLVLVSPFFLQRRPSWWHRQAWLMQQALRLLGANDLAAQLDHAPAALWQDAYQLLQKPEVRQHNAQWLSWAGQAQTRAHYRHLLASLAIPITLVHGTQDPLLFQPQNPAIRDIIAIENSGHYPQMTHPTQLSETIRQAISQQLPVGPEVTR